MKLATVDQLTPTVFDAFRLFINQRSGIDSRNYFSDWRDKDGHKAFRSETRSIQKDGERARKALTLATAYPFNAEAMMDATRSFSGRLQIVIDEKKGFAIDYTTGQYFPTEYRKAAAVVLETYCETVRPKTVSGRIPQTITELKEMSHDAGSHFFDRGSMKFFRCRVVPNVYTGPGGVYFVTSEQYDDNTARRYTVRKFDPATADIETVGAFNESTRENALATARNLAKAAKE